MGAKKLVDVFQAMTDTQLQLAGGTEGTYTERLKASYRRLVGVTVWEHQAFDAIIYVQDCGQFGFKAIKFYNCGIDYRIGSFQESEAQALHEAINTL